MIVGTIVVAVVASLLSPAARRAKIDARLEEDAKKSMSQAD